MDIKMILKKNNELKLLYTSAEVYPYAGVGGLGQVSYFLTKALIKEGVDARIFMPKYGNIDEKKYKLKTLFKDIKIPTNSGRDIICNIKTYKENDISPTIYFLENMEFYEKRSNVYGYNDDHIRFLLLSLGVIEFLKISEWAPDVINAADWHTGHIPNLLKINYKNDQKLSKIATIFSIHNIMHQGLFDHKNINDLDFDNGKGEILDLFNPNLRNQNFLRRGIMYADMITTVSEKYSKEILNKEHGEGLNKLLCEVRTKLIGILNGIDYTYMNPETDKNLVANYNATNIQRRLINKTDLQKEFDLNVGDFPILSMVTRLDTQKGLDLVMEILEPLIKENEDIQFVIIGGGDGRYVQFFHKMENKYPKRVGTHLMQDYLLPKKVFSGADVILIPSYFEPSGITQMEAMRYGCIPVARAVGGLYDSIDNFDIKTMEGNGFLFTNFSSFSLYGAITKALDVYQNKNMWNKIIISAMNKDFSWENSAKKYIATYNKAIEINAKNNDKFNLDSYFFSL